ncbi:MAG: arsenate reductase ArsC [Alphaproteobacteria bacterium]|nr:MAG: arsenate reductase ArsC [Alphaproteobacteria bacterium]
MKILILCTGNSCRSIIAEALFNYLGQGRVIALSAGSKPTGQVHPRSLALLKSKGMSTAHLRSKSWDEFVLTPLDIVITVCDSAAGEACPVFTGAPVKAHWGLPDPAHARGTEAEINAAFESVYKTLEARIKAFLKLPTGLDKKELSDQLRTIGETIV